MTHLTRTKPTYQVDFCELPQSGKHIDSIPPDTRVLVVSRVEQWYKAYSGSPGIPCLRILYKGRLGFVLRDSLV